jgi:hypothetical protein
MDCQIPQDFAGAQVLKRSEDLYRKARWGPLGRQTSIVKNMVGKEVRANTQLPTAPKEQTALFQFRGDLVKLRHLHGQEIGHAMVELRTAGRDRRDRCIQS